MELNGDQPPAEASRSASPTWDEGSRGLAHSGEATFFLKGGEFMPNKQNVEAFNMLRDKLSRSQLSLVSEFLGLSVVYLIELCSALHSSNAEVIDA